jgi:3-phenylpropionate/trans-cinnamate dioxygenase ferredoxin reductase subunit
VINSIAVVGANMAGARAAESLRSAGYDGHIHLIGEEPWRPYERPPLSKEFLWEGGTPSGSFYLHDEHWYASNKVELRLGVRTTAIDLRAGALRLASGEAVQADRILLATGGAARRLPLPRAEAANVHHLRTLGDAAGLAADLRPGAQIVIIGMGVIGAEVAASARRMGCNVTAVEPFASPMIRALGDHFGAWLGEHHRMQGVRALYGRSVKGLRLSGAKVCAVELDDGEELACDAVVVGIGIVPAVELAADAGLIVGNGIVVDAQCRTSNPVIFAAGDVAEQPDFFGGRVRMETYQNAAEQGAAAAAAMLGQPVEYCRPCWFWSDQYDLNIQVTGRIDAQQQLIMRGRVEDDAFCAFFLAGDLVMGALTANRSADMGVAKRLVERRARVGPAELADVDVPLREILKKSAS